jgi:two-component system, NtrC family, response regulator AtoC
MRAELNQSLRVDLADLPSEGVIFGCTTAMREVQSKIDLLRSSDSPVLIQGESGTGKEVIARFLHARSDRHRAPFVKLNCAAIPANLLERELFGSASGSSKGAKEDRPGLVEIAEGGSIFLDEIGEMNWGLQGKLLQLLQDCARLSADEPRAASVRVICASNIDLQSAVQGGTFRKELLERISAVCLHLPALRERKSDIPQLCDYFLQKLARQLNRVAPSLKPPTLQLLKNWVWPGNLRELENLIARTIVLGEDPSPGAELGRQVAVKRAFEVREQGTESLGERPGLTTSVATGALILKALQTNHWNRRKTAEDLSMSHRSLLYKLREGGVPSRRRGRRSLPPHRGSPFSC